jgi:putative two-component system response regulator
MRLPKIVIGQTDSKLSELLHVLVVSGDYEIHIAERGDRVLEISRLGLPPDLIVLETTLQHPDTRDLCVTFKQDPSFSAVPILIVDVAAEQVDSGYVQAGCDDALAGPLHSETLIARVKSLLRLKSISDERDDAETVLHALARTIEAKDPYTLGHADRVAQYAVELGKALGVNAHETQVLRQGGMLHDVGKIAIPDAILLKPGRYTPEEFAIMKRHPVLGCEICGKLRTVKEALPLIRHHHEKLDGSGYPDGLRGTALTPLVRIISIVDIYDALRSQRSYKEAFTVDKSFEIMWQEVDKGWWDRDVLSAWEAIVRSSKRAANAD